MQCDSVPVHDMTTKTRLTISTDAQRIHIHSPVSKPTAHPNPPRRLPPTGTAQYHTKWSSKPYIAQAPHLPSHAEPARLSPDDLRPKPNKHTNGIAHSEFLARAQRPHHAQIDALERRRVRHTRTARTKRKEHRRRQWQRGHSRCRRRRRRRRHGRRRRRRGRRSLAIPPSPVLAFRFPGVCLAHLIRGESGKPELHRWERWCGREYDICRRATFAAVRVRCHRQCRSQPRAARHDGDRLGRRRT